MKKIILIILFKISLFGVEAYRGEIKFTQNDNKSFKAYLKGDEWFDWVDVDDGYVAQFNNKSENYEYMLLDENNELVYSNVKVEADSTAITRGILKRENSLPVEIKKISMQQMGKIWEAAFKRRNNR